MSTIRPTPLPSTPLPPSGADAGRLAAQKAFFALISGQAQVAAAAPVEPQAASAARSVSPPADPAQKILRPGSLLDIRV